MTDKTPIEKAADYLIDQFSDTPLGNEDPEHVADCIRRVLGEEVPKRESPEANVEFQMYDIGHNQCRRDIGMDD